jgi:hypothetical protein
MPTFNIKEEDLIPNINIAINCYNTEESRKVLEIMETEGIIWIDEQKATSCIPKGKVHILYKHALQYGFGNVEVDDDNDYMVISAEEFIKLKRPSETTLFRKTEKKTKPLDW